MKNVANKIFIGIVALALLSGLALALIAPVEINEAENRYAEKIKPLSFASYLNSEFQDSVEKALADQMIASSELKEGYNTLSGKYSKVCLDWTINRILAQEKAEDNEKTEEEKPQSATESAITSTGGISSPSAVVITSESAITTATAIETGTESAISTESAIETKPDNKEDSVVTGEADTETTAGKKYSYISVGNGMFNCNGYLVSGLVSPINSIAKRLNDHIPTLNKFVDDYPELSWYIYYIEDESDTSFASLKRSGTFEYLKERLTSFNPDNVQRLVCDSFEKYEHYFYKSDHHWAYEGSYRGYSDIMSMLKPGASLLQPTETYKLGIFYGSFTKTDTTAAYHDDLYVYDFDFPEMEITSGSKTLADYGDAKARIEKVKAGGSTNNKTTYANVYGTDIGEIIFHNPGGSGSLLMFGNSYDNAVLKLIASHYEYVYSIDMRYYKNVTGKDFSFASYYAAHPDITQVLQIGTVEYFIQGAYLFGE